MSMHISFPVKKSFLVFRVLVLLQQRSHSADMFKDDYKQSHSGVRTWHISNVG